MKCYDQQVIFWRLVMNDDDWSWMMVNTPRKKDVCEVMRWCECTKCKIFHHTKIYRIYRIYKIYHSFLYTLQYLHFPWFLQPGWTKSSLSALISGVQTCTLLLHCKYWEPWQAKSSLSTHMPRGVQIMLCWVPPKSWWDGIYKMYLRWSFSALWLQTLRLWCFSDFGQTERNWV